MAFPVPGIMVRMKRGSRAPSPVEVGNGIGIRDMIDWWRILS